MLISIKLKYIEYIRYINTYVIHIKYYTIKIKVMQKPCTNT